MRNLVWLHTLTLVFVAASFVPSIAQGAEDEKPAEISLTDKEIARLDIFEERALFKAEADFDREDYAAARVKFKAFLKKHPKSRAAAHVLLRTARCAELDGKRGDAIGLYLSVAEHYPSTVKYAIPALMYAADGHLAEGAGDQAIGVWTRLVENAAYRNSPQAVVAMERLLKTAAEGGNPADALKLCERLKIDWRRSTNEIVKKFVDAAVRQHVRDAPDQDKLLTFYKQKFEDVGAQPESSLKYWTWVGDMVLKNGKFSYSEDVDRKKYYEHWIGVFKDKFPESDDMAIVRVRLQYGVDRDRAKIAKRLDDLFKKNKKSDWKRTIKWVRAYKGNWTKMKQYSVLITYESGGVEGVASLVETLVKENNERYLASSAFEKFREKVPFDKLSNEQVMKLIFTAQTYLEDKSVAGGLVEKLHFDKMTEEEKLKLFRKFLQADATLARKICNRLDNKSAARLELFEHLLKTDEQDLAIEVAGDLAKDKAHAPKFAQRWAEMLKAAGRHSEAVGAYRKCGNRPEILWKIVECYVGMNETESAVEQLRAIATAHKKHGPKALYQIVMLYREAGDEAKHLAALHDVMKKYPDSAEAEKAEGELGEKGGKPNLPSLQLGF